MCLDETSQLVTQVELAHRNLGPKQYGIFKGGRIEEFLDCRSIEYSDSVDPEIEADIAKNFARLHAIDDLPFKRPAFEYGSVVRAMHADLLNLMSRFEDMENQALVRVARHDYAPLVALIDPLLDLESRNRMTFTNWDPHFGNIVIMNNRTEGQLRALILDFEAASYNARGKDLGLFLVSRSGFHPKPRPERRLETKQEFSRFLQAYQSESASLVADFDVSGRDSLDQLYLESLVGGIVSILIFIFFQLKIIALRVDEGNPVLRTYSLGVPLWLEAVLQCESALRSGFPDLVREIEGQAK